MAKKRLGALQKRTMGYEVLKVVHGFWLRHNARSSAMTCVLGFDPSLNASGLALFDMAHNDLILSEELTMSVDASTKTKLQLIKNTIERILQDYGPVSFAVESVNAMGNFYAMRALSYVMGVVQASLDVLSPQPILVGYTSTCMKKAITGNGKATKVEIVEAHRVGVHGIHFETDNEADAFSAALITSALFEVALAFYENFYKDGEWDTYDDAAVKALWKRLPEELSLSPEMVVAVRLTVEKNDILRDNCDKQEQRAILKRVNLPLDGDGEE